MVLRRLITVDDAESVRHSLQNLLRQFGFAARSFSSATEFLASDAVAESSCLILDVEMPEMSGPDLQHELKRRRRALPIIFITASTDEGVRQPFSNGARWNVCSSPLAIPRSGRRSMPHSRLEDIDDRRDQ
jgi:FixJ family two-component response regulator